MGQTDLSDKDGGGFVRWPNQFVSRHCRKRIRERCRRFQKLAGVIPRTCWTSSADIPSSSRRKNASAMPLGSLDRHWPKTSQNSRVSIARLGSPLHAAGLTRQWPRWSKDDSSTPLSETPLPVACVRPDLRS